MIAMKKCITKSHWNVNLWTLNLKFLNIEVQAVMMFRYDAIVSIPNHNRVKFTLFPVELLSMSTSLGIESVLNNTLVDWEIFLVLMMLLAVEEEEMLLLLILRDILTSDEILTSLDIPMIFDLRLRTTPLNNVTFMFQGD